MSNLNRQRLAGVVVTAPVTGIAGLITHSVTVSGWTAGACLLGWTAGLLAQALWPVV